MKGWTPDGREVELLPWQEEAVRLILDATESGARQLVIHRPRSGGKSTVSATAARLIKERGKHAGSPAPGA